MFSSDVSRATGDKICMRRQDRSRAGATVFSIFRDVSLPCWDDDWLSAAFDGGCRCDVAADVDSNRAEPKVLAMHDHTVW